MKALDIEIEGSPMRFYTAGRGPALVLGHSYLWDAAMWAPQVAALSAHFTVVIPELWGHGASGPLPVTTQALSDVGRQILKGLDAMDIERFGIVGLSVGGMWGAEIALQASARVTSLVLVDTYVGAEPEASRRDYFAMFAAIEVAGRIPPPILEGIVPLFFGPDVDTRHPGLADGFRQRLETWDMESIRHSVIPLGRMIFGRCCVLEPLAGTTMPKAVITGRYDRPRPVSEGLSMAQALGCPFATVADAGHISSLEAPETLTRSLLDFLLPLYAEACNAR